MGSMVLFNPTGLRPPYTEIGKVLAVEDGIAYIEGARGIYRRSLDDIEILEQNII